MRGAQSLLTSHSEALWSTYKPLTRPDDVLLARLLKPQVRLRTWILSFDPAMRAGDRVRLLGFGA